METQVEEEPKEEGSPSKDVIETTAEEVPSEEVVSEVPEGGVSEPHEERSEEGEQPAALITESEARTLENTTANAYVKSGRLCIFGLTESILGPIPFAYSVELPEGIPDGPMDFGGEMPEEVSAAIVKAQKPMASAIEIQKMRIGAEQLVERSRAGDQNAMAMLQAIGIAARKGVARARASFIFIKKYIKKHPLEKKVEMVSTPSPAVSLGPVARQLGRHVGNDTAVAAWTPAVPDIYCAALMLANGPPMFKSRVSNIGSHFNGEESGQFWYGVRHWEMMVEGSEANFTGRAVGLARTIQGVREGVLPVSKLSPLAGWELGEEV